MLLAILFALVFTAPASAAQPNILVVMTDDQRADGTLTVMPQTLRQIARRGTTFLEAHVTTPKCCPSRASFFTAQYAHNHRVVNNNVPARLDHGRTVQRLLHDRGYRTGIFGKFLNAWPLKVDPPFFDDWAISNGGFNDITWNIDGQLQKLRRYTTDLISDRTARFIRESDRRDDDQPWLAWVTPSAPHLPSTPAPRHRDARLPRFVPTPAIDETDFSDKPPFLDNARGYPGMIATARDDGRRSLMAVDEMVGRLMGQLRRLKEAKDTLVVFVSDNGFMLGEHGGVVGKDLPYPASTRVPLIVRWPGRVAEGRENHKLVTNVDVSTTILRAAGVERQTDGRSLFARKAHTRLFGESFGAKNNRGTQILPPWRSLRTRKYRYAEYYRERGGKREIIFREYYDLSRDPWELENRADSLTADEVAELSGAVRRLSRCKGRACP